MTNKELAEKLTEDLEKSGYVLCCNQSEKIIEAALNDAEKRGMDRARRMVKEKAAYYFRAVEGHIEPTKSRGIFAHNCMLAMSVEISKAAKEIK